MATNREVREISVEEAVDILITGSHPQVEAGTIEMDVAMIDALRAGVVRAGIIVATGELAFMK